MDEQAVCPLSYSEMMTVGPSAPPIMPMADLFLGSAPLCVLSPSAQSVISSASFDISGEMSTRRSVKNFGSSFPICGNCAKLCRLISVTVSMCVFPVAGFVNSVLSPGRFALKCTSETRSLSARRRRESELIFFGFLPRQGILTRVICQQNDLSRPYFSSSFSESPPSGRADSNSRSLKTPWTTPCRLSSP